MGGLSAVDSALVKTQGNINDLRSTYDAMKAKAAALTFTDKFFNGDNSTDPNEFDGLKNRLTGSQVIDMPASTDGGDALTLAKIDELMDAGHRLARYSAHEQNHAPESQLSGAWLPVRRSRPSPTPSAVR